MAEVIQEFLVESREILEKLERDILALERTPKDGTLLGSIFRCVHTIKGNSSFLGFPNLQALSHAGESLLSVLREGRLRLSPPMSAALFELVDVSRAMLEAIRGSGKDAGVPFAALAERLSGMATSDAQGSPPEAPAPAGDEVAGRAASAPEPSIRVDVGLLDRLMNLVGELVLSRNAILREAASSKDLALTKAAQRLNGITSRLQEGIMKARMQPIGNVWSRFPRLVRDLALNRGKRVRLELEGEGTELDRTILEAIGDPLVHLLRNSVDHGIETPGSRVAGGKPEEGRIRLRAFHEGGHVVIELSDDGGGVDTARLRAKALQAGLISSERASRMSDADAVNLMFIPGLSTAEKVTDLSGRGVGMDVVKANIERIGGTVDVQSVPGDGTVTRLHLPLTLAIVPALLVRLGGERFAIPQGSLQELLRLEGAEATRAIEAIHDAPVFRLRGRLLPLVRLAQLFGRPAPETADEVSIVVLRGRDRLFGLIVDEILDTQEIVVKPICRVLKDLEAFAGATILGDGQVALIIDVTGLARRAGLGLDSGSRPAGEEEATPVPAAPRRRLLLVRSSDDGRMALPLDAVTRLEEFPRSAIERAGALDVIQYRRQILPLIDIAASLPERRRRARTPLEPQAADSLPVIVVSKGSRYFGLIVQGILDIVEEDEAALRPSSRPGVLRCVVLRDRVTELVDLDTLLKDFEGPEVEAAQPAQERKA
jgi:two-component system chemotaxis sensor kinase CheA